MFTRTHTGAFATLSLFALFSSVRAGSYGLQETSVGSSFYNNFQFDAIADPTHGRVVYVDESTARNQNLTYASGDTFILRTDSRNVLNANGPGRNSVRLKSRRQWNTHVTVIDLRHLPQGCGTWPAIWEFGPNWPYEGEIDIVEGVNDVGPNQSALHTDSGCTMSNLQQTGNLLHSDCSAYVDSNTGCTVQFTKPNSYGPSFNNAGGGYFAMERTSTAVKIWFWPRNGGGAPSEVVNGSSQINTDNWGTPMANYNNANCNISSKFRAANIIINLTLCGDWAGQSSVWQQSACANQGDCVSYVNNNPGAFTNSYFDFKALRVYEGGGGSTNSTSNPGSTTTTTSGGGNGCTVAKWGQCGGSGYTGCTTCAAGSTCQVGNPYYSQCL